jgi:hypothetical protein
MQRVPAQSWPESVDLSGPIAKETLAIARRHTRGNVGRQRSQVAIKSEAKRSSGPLVGRVAQLGERGVRNAKVAGSIPVTST